LTVADRAVVWPHVERAIYLTDDGYVLKVVDSHSYFPLPPEKITALQEKGDLPTPPAYSIPGSDYVTGTRSGPSSPSSSASFSSSAGSGGVSKGRMSSSPSRRRRRPSRSKAIASSSTKRRRTSARAKR
jgi:hypothetical protein